MECNNGIKILGMCHSCLNKTPMLSLHINSFSQNFAFHVTPHVEDSRKETE